MITTANFTSTDKSLISTILQLVLRIRFLGQVLLLLPRVNANTLGTISEEITKQLLPMGVCNFLVLLIGDQQSPFYLSLYKVLVSCLVSDLQLGRALR